MNLDLSVLDLGELTALRLRSLYAEKGYRRFRMMKFEEYDLYSHNKDFLVSENIITFTDVTGRLMALKPDVTLSIVKSAREGEKRRVYYNESVYRPASGSFRELSQVGVEAIGEPDAAEIVALAEQSLGVMAQRHVLQLSHMGLIDRVTGGDRRLIRCIGEKNLHELGDNPDAARLIALSGAPDEILPELRPLAEKYGAIDALSELETAAKAAESSVIDFSDVSDTGYYTGLLFKGFVPGVPGFVLSGGSYDGLMRKMGRSGSAMGFAVYLDMLERLGEEGAEC